MFALKPKEVIEYEKDKDLIDDFLLNRSKYLENPDEEIKEKLRYVLSLDRKWRYNSLIHESLGYEFSLIEKYLGPERPKLMNRNLEKITVSTDIEKSEYGTEAEKIEKTESDFSRQIPETYRPALENLLRYYKSKGVVGEESTCILQTLGAIHKLYFGIESLSGSGKSFVAEAMMDLLPREDVYKMELSSNTAEIYEASRINKKKIIYIPELQKALRSNNPIILEVIKNLTEGKAVSRKVRDHANKRNLEFTINGDKGIIYTLAYENDFKKDAELSRRVFQLYTDISEEQTKKILESIAEQQWNSNNNIISEEELSNLRAHLKSCLYLPDYQYINPFSEMIIKNIPPNIKARSFVKHYFNLIQACAKYHNKDRIVSKSESKLFVNLQDIYTIHQTYGKDFLKTLLKIPMLGEKILDILGKTDSELSDIEIYEQVRAKKMPLSFEFVRNSLEQLVDAGFLEKANKQYRKIENYSYNKNIDWRQYWHSGLKIMEDHYLDILEEWKEKQMQDNKLIVYDSIKNKSFVLFEENGTIQHTDT